MSYKSDTKELVEQLKAENQDFEFYPTNTKMLGAVIKDISSRFTSDNRRFNHDDSANEFSMLDIGAGDGHSLAYFKEKLSFTKLFAIEKSPILRERMDKSIIVIGTDFFDQTLIDKSATHIFCNPPYSEYERWVNVVLSTSNAVVTYMVIPERWKDSQGIMQVIKDRNIQFKVLDTMDFLDGARAARAVVDVVRFETGNEAKSAFTEWFDKTFGFNDAIKKDEPSIKEQIEKEQAAGSPIDKSKLVKGKSYIETITSLYDRDINTYLESYKNLCKVEAYILNGVGITKDTIMRGLREKMDGLKVVYWAELMQNLTTLTERVPSATRYEILQKMNMNMHVDFTMENIYSVVCWVLKNLNDGIDEHTKNMYRKMTEPENVHNYKSNHRIVDDKWRYLRDHTEYYLDYRMIHSNYGCIESDWHGGYRLSSSSGDFLGDLMIVARNLGYRITDDAKDKVASYSAWEPGKPKTIYYVKNGVELVFCEVKAHKKGTFHFKFCQEFMRALNVEAGRLFGWLKSPSQAADEMNEPIELMDDLFLKSNHLTIGNTTLMLTE